MNACSCWTYPVEAGKKIEILIESNNQVRPVPKPGHTGPTHGYGGCRIGYVERPSKDLFQEAADAAASADVAIVVVGLDAEWESEGYDRQTMDLPKDGNQDRLISAVAAANPRTIVVNQSGTPVTMPWAHEVPAIIQAWYQGQEAGNALADVLLGIQTRAENSLLLSQNACRKAPRIIIGPVRIVVLFMVRVSMLDTATSTACRLNHSLHSGTGFRTLLLRTANPASARRCSPGQL